ncbi:MAG TPA: hypothetical protein VGM67_01640 [Gemmatimonadaceae bacterium]|jgi:hypothetical protein
MLKQRTRAAWFRPKTLGWGVTPVTWQGWAATFGLVGALLLGVHYLGKGPAGIAVMVAGLVAFAVIVKLGGCEAD